MNLPVKEAVTVPFRCKACGTHQDAHIWLLADKQGRSTDREGNTLLGYVLEPCCEQPDFVKEAS